MNTIISFLFLLAVTGSFSANAGMSPQFKVLQKTDSLPGAILIINAFNAGSLHQRKNKKELFGELADSLQQYLYDEIRYRKKGEPEIFAKRPDPGSWAGDSSILRIIDQEGISIAIVIRSLDVHFEQTGVEVTKEEGGKKRVASYDICSVVMYDTYGHSGKIKSSETKSCEFFTQRNVISGLFSGGPDVVGKSKYAFKIVNENAVRFLLFDFPKEE